MSEVADIKRFILRALFAMQGVPMPGEALDQAVRSGMVPRPLQSDIKLAREQLSDSEFIIGTLDKFDDVIYWALTRKGEIRAKQL